MRKLIAVLCLVVLAQRASAQLAWSAARIDSLRRAAAAANARLKAYDDSVRALNGRMDSARVGPLRIYAEPQLIALATAAARQLHDSLASRMPRSLNRLARYSYVMSVERFNRWQTQKLDSNIVIDTYDRSGPPMASVRQRFDTALVSTSMRIYAPFLVFRDASPSFTAWMSNQVNLDSLSRDDWRGLRLALVSSPAVIGRHCYEGDLRACAMALGVTPPMDTIREWFDAGDRLQIVKRSKGVAMRVDAAATARCLDGQDFSCVALLRRYPPGTIPAPLPDGTHASLARFAIALGGQGAVDRMLAREGEPMERVAAAARLPADTVLSRWLQSARSQRASSRDLTPEIAMASIFWSLVLGALSLRSSRWR
jgi:hypothetical protein